MKMKSIITFLSIFSLITLILYSCGSRDEKPNERSKKGTDK